MKPLAGVVAGVLVFHLTISSVWAFVRSSLPELPNLDCRPPLNTEQISAERKSAIASVQVRVPGVLVDFDERLATPKWVRSADGFLSGPAQENGAGMLGNPPADVDRPTFKFIEKNQELFGFGLETVTNSGVRREFTTAHNGLHTVIWQQRFEGLEIFEALLISHTTRDGALVSISSFFVPEPMGAANTGTPRFKDAIDTPQISGTKAVALAVSSLGDSLDESNVVPVQPDGFSAERAMEFEAPPLCGNGHANLAWLPMSQESLRLCWDILLTLRSRGEMFRLLVDAETGDVLVRHCLTEYVIAVPATYRVFTGDSPSPFSPGYSSPQSTQPPLVTRDLITIFALDPVASPNGWMDASVSETCGNNVDAHTDRDADNVPDLPRPQGGSARVFDFSLDLAQSPSAYTNTAVVQLFYWNNWMHDRLYQLGFDEAAGNFQNDNFARGGAAGDAVQADGQDGAGYNNANFSTPPDGWPGRMQMYVFNGPTPNRDGDLDAEVILHEYTHGLSNRRVGGGVGLTAWQSRGLGEGWSDFYALALLSEGTDDINGAYAEGGYVSYRSSPGYDQNYYFGIRRYPYSTDTNKNPLTLNDIDPAQADFCNSIAPFNTGHFGFCSTGSASEVHNMGEVWCVTLWDARANLVNKYGWEVGNELVLQLVTDAMNLTPANPTFLQARDAILLADQVDNAGANRIDLWKAFAKRGMGLSATSPSSSVVSGIVESYDMPDDLGVAPMTGFASVGGAGGPFLPVCQSFLLGNGGIASVTWVAYSDQPWVEVAPYTGTLSPGGTNIVSVCLNDTAAALSPGAYTATVIFSNTVSGGTCSRGIALGVSRPRAFFFGLDSDPGWTREGQWEFGKPAGQGGRSFGYHDPTAGATGTNVLGVNLNGDYSIVPGSPFYLTAGPLDFSGYSGVQLQFQRWLNTDYPPFVYQNIEISTNRSGWYSVWGNGGSAIVDTSWTQVQYDISTWADNCSVVFVRWGYQIGYWGAYPYSGWNIDDIEFLGNPTRVLSLDVPSNVPESSGTVAATLRVYPAPSGDLLVALSSSDTSEISVPASVTVHAGQTNVEFSISVIDDGELDGPQSVTVMASAPSYASASRAMTLLDDETATLTVVAPAEATEGDGQLLCMLMVSAAPAVDVQVSLSTSDMTVVQLPGSVTLPAGKTWMTFYATVVDDGRIDGNQTATINAHVPGWTDGSASIIVHDNEGTNLSLVVPANAREGNGILRNAGSVRISGTLFSNVVVSLHSSDETELLVPATITIPAGQICAYFSPVVIDDTDLDGPRTITVTATANGFAQDSRLISIDDNESPLVPFAPFPVNFGSNATQMPLLSWASGALPGEAIGNEVYFGISPDLGPAELQGVTTDSNWQVGPLLPLTTYYWRVIAHKLGATSGPVWQFTTRGPEHFVLSTVASPQVAGQPFAINVSARDIFDHVVTNFDGIVDVSATAGSNAPRAFLENFEDTDFAGWDIGSGIYTRTVTGETSAGGSYSLKLIGGSHRHANGISHSLSNITPAQVTFYVRSSTTNLYDGYFLLGTNMYNSTIAVWFYMRQDGTMGINEDQTGYHGVPYEPNRWYKITFKLDWKNGCEDFYVDDVLAYSNIPFRGTITNLTKVYLYNYDYAQAWFDEIEFSGGNLPEPVIITPSQFGPFSGGSWSGDATIWQGGSNIVVEVDDDRCDRGCSNPFDVAVQNNLALSGAAWPRPVPLGGSLTCSFSMTNSGPSPAFGVMLTNVLDPDASFAWASASQGSWSINGNNIVFDLGPVYGGSSAGIQFGLMAMRSGNLTNVMTITQNAPEANTSDNTIVTISPVLLPSVSIGDVSVYEGNVGSNYAAFPVTLSAPDKKSASVSYSTVDGTATSGSDYVACTGSLTFAAGETAKLVYVPVLGDIAVEPDERFYVDLSTPVNATLSKREAVGVIVNDDGFIGQIDHFIWTGVPSARYAGQPFRASVLARDAFDFPVTDFTGLVSIAATTDQGLRIPLTPCDCGFECANWTGDFTAGCAATNVTLRADDGNGHIGLSDKISFLPYPTLNYSRSAGPLTLTWAGSATLQWATNAGGPFLTLPGIGSPCTLSYDWPSCFFRLEAPPADTLFKSNQQ